MYVWHRYIIFGFESEHVEVKKKKDLHFFILSIVSGQLRKKYLFLTFIKFKIIKNNNKKKFKLLKYE